MDVSEQVQQTEAAALPAPRNFVIPGCDVVIQGNDDTGMPIEQLLAIVFNLASSNPEAKVDFWIKVKSDG